MTYKQPASERARAAAVWLAKRLPGSWRAGNAGAPREARLAHRFGVMLLTCLALAGCERWELDRKMEELCRKDGGVRVYERVQLSGEQYQALITNAGRAPNRGDQYYGAKYRYLESVDILVGKSADALNRKGQLRRITARLYRRSDGKLLGEVIHYDRSGGDGYTFGFQPSGNMCPKPRPSLISAIFVEGAKNGK